jgi:hypothetical protein
MGRLQTKEKDMPNLTLTRVAAAVALLAAAAALTISASRVAAAPSTLQGAWLLTVTKSGHATGATMVSSFAAGNVLIAADSRKPGAGIGWWSRVGSNGFRLTYLKYQFGSNGKLNSTIIARAKGTFQGSSLSGQISFAPVDPYGSQGGPAIRFTFTGRRIAAQSP